MKRTSALSHIPKGYIRIIYPTEWTPATVEENQQRVINDIKEIFGIQNFCSFSEPAKLSVEFTNTPKYIGSSYMAQQKALYAKAYERWTAEDDQKLLFLYSQGKNISELMQIFCRNKGAIKSRISKLTGDI